MIQTKSHAKIREIVDWIKNLVIENRNRLARVEDYDWKIMKISNQSLCMQFQRIFHVNISTDIEFIEPHHYDLIN